VLAAVLAYAVLAYAVLLGESVSWPLAAG